MTASGARRVAVIVGAASGMGRASALRLAEDGFAIGLADRDAAGMSTIAEQLRSAGVPNHAVTMDVAAPESVERGIEALEEALGAPWLLAVSAAILEVEWVLDAPYEHFRRVLDTNLLGVIAVNAAAARRMVAAGNGGRIVNWSSNNAVGGTAYGSAYAASKAGVDAFSQSLAVELGPYGITVNTLRAGSVRTPMLAHLDQAAVDQETARIPAGRWGEPEDVAAVVSFLARDEAGWVTGAAIPVDGGTLANHGRPQLAEAVRRAREER
jgi:NAD(P)-dependent dehydrogenase (short-subunit alcohol dehydrogenase family)